MRENVLATLSLPARVTTALALIALCSRSPTQAEYELVQTQPEAEALLVFVHGFGGNGGSMRNPAGSTWTHGKTAAYWPSIARSDDAFARFDILVYSYDTSVVSLLRGDHFTPFELGRELVNFLAHRDYAKYTTTIFVAHSLGGVLLQEALIYDDDLARRTPFIYLFSVPTAGSRLAAQLSEYSFFDRKRLIRAIREGSGDVKRRLGQWEKKVQPLVTTFCAVESRRTFLVEELSALMKCDDTSDVHGKHRDIVKPRDRFAAPHAALQTALWKKLPELYGPFKKLYLSEMPTEGKPAVHGRLGKNSTYWKPHTTIPNLGPHTIILNGDPKPKGLVTHPFQNGPAVISYSVPLGAREFRATVGLARDKAAYCKGSVRFTVSGEGVVSQFGTPVIGRGEEQDIEVPVRPGKLITLMVENGGEGNWCNGAVWVEARFE